MASLPDYTTSPQSTLPHSMTEEPIDPIGSVQGRLATQHTASSRGPLASPPSPSQVASTRYVHQYRTLMDKQRKIFGEERDLWHTERSELLEEIAHLQAKLRQAQGSSPSQARSPINMQGSGGMGFSGFSGFPTISRHTSTGDEFWRGAGGKSDAQPTRTFSDPPNQLSNVGERLPSISENEPQTRTSLLTDSLSRPAIPSIPGGGDLDGITFKRSSDTFSNDSSLATPQSPSPSQTSSRALKLPPSQLQPTPECNTMHAGHTPLARGSRHHTDGAASGGSSSPTTPTQSEVERPPHEPRASFVRPPAERSDSYFAGAVDADPALSEPLGLPNASRAGESFLEAVDSKLEAAAKENDEKAKESSAEHGTTAGRAESEHPEPEPKLKIKRSMNFGSQFGSLR